MTTSQNLQAASALLERLQLAIERKLDDVLGDLQTDMALLEEQLDGLAAAVKELTKQTKSTN
jgi:uncharacterized protein involved in exopolysaccharide biosynthesis